MGFVARLAAIFVFVYLLLRFIPGIPVTSVVTQKQDLFTVNGEGKVTVIPDTAIVNLGISSTKITVKAAQTEANTVIKNITLTLKSLQIADSDIKTSNYSIYPQYDFTNGQNHVTGYQVNANLSITVRNIDQVNQVVDQSTSQGANSISGIQLTVDDTRLRDLANQARQIAVKEAMAKANTLAQAAGISLGKVINIQESSPTEIRPMMAKSFAPGMGAGVGDTQIQPGSTDITSTVILSYETR